MDTVTGLPMLTILDALPGGFLNCEPTRLHTILSGPTLIHLEGRRSPPVFVSILLHGNEYTGLLAVQKLLRRYQGRGLPRDLSIFVGNVAAARFGLRRLDHQPDYNRIWQGNGTPEHDAVQRVVEEMAQRKVVASIDIHNNTGHNPHYACINRLDHRFLHLAALFNRTVVYFTKPEGVQSAAFARLCPAVTLECGRPGEPRGIEHAFRYLDAALNLSEFPAHPVVPGDIDLFHTVAIVKIPRDISFGFGDTSTDIRFIEDLDRLNFSELPAGTCLAHTDPNKRARLDVRDERGEEVSSAYFTFDDQRICTRTEVMPAMLTLNPQVIRQDCLCYLMERLPVPEASQHY